MSDKLNTLVVVPGHAIYFGNNQWGGAFAVPERIYDETPLLGAHIEAGVKYAEEASGSLLVFSGGQTRKECGQISEAFGYMQYAKEHLGLSKIESRITTEEFARDSFENVLFSIHRFWQWTKNWPDKVIVLGYGFKKERFEYHAEYLNNKLEKFKIGVGFEFEYRGVNDPQDFILEDVIDEETAKVIKKGSRTGEADTLSDFKCEAGEGNMSLSDDAKDEAKQRLAAKRKGRDCFRRGNPYFDNPDSWSCQY